MYLVIKCIGSRGFQRKSGKVFNLPDSYQYALNLYEDDTKFKKSIPNFSNSMEIV